MSVHGVMTRLYMALSIEYLYWYEKKSLSFLVYKMSVYGVMTRLYMAISIEYIVCPGSSDPFYIATLLYKMGQTF